MAQGSLNTLLSNDLVRLGLIAVVAVIILFALARRRPAPWPTSGEADAAAERGPAVPVTWAPPSQPAPPRADAGPALAVNAILVENHADRLQVSWQAINGGSIPLAVQWGPPVVRRSGESLELRYCYDAGDTAAPFEAPLARTCGPGEVLSRSTSLSRATTGGDPAGLLVAVVLGFGAAADHAVAQIGPDTYVSWQHVARSRPRPIPAAGRQPLPNN